MKFLRDEDGIALVTALMFTMLALVISMALLYMVITGTRTSGALKRYKTALDATYGGTELFTKELINKALAFPNYSSSSNPFTTYLQNEMGSLAGANVSACLHMRLNTPKRLWDPACSAESTSPKISPDVTFKLNASTGSPYVVYSKIVDTSEWRITSFPGTGLQVTNSIAGNSDPTGVDNLTKGGTIDSNPPELPHYPFIYRIEIQGERENNPIEKGDISVLYAY